MTALTRRLGTIAVAVTCGATVLTVAPGTATAAGIGTATPSPSSVANTAKAQAVTITNSVPAIGSAQVQMVGPGSLSDTYTGTGTNSSGSATTFNLDPSGLPAAPGTYTLNVCEISCPTTLDSGSITVVGAPPAPRAVGSPFQVAPGGTVTAFALSGTGFAKDETISIPRPDGAASDATFTENNAGSSATLLAGSLGVNAAVPPAVYDLQVTDTAGRSGSCPGCLQVTGPTDGPGPVVGLTVTATSARTAAVAWSAPTTGPTATGYTVVVSKTSSSTSDPGIAVAMAGTSATVTGLAPASSYFVTVTPVADANAGTPRVTTLHTPNPTTLSLTASKSTYTVGQQSGVTLSGVLVHTVGSNPPAPLAGKTIVISAKSDTGAVRPVTTVQTKSDGSYRFTAFPKTNARYGAFFAGDDGGSSGTGDSPALSNAFPRVTVAPLVVAAPKHRRIRKGATALVLGYVSPNEAGRTVTLVRIDGTGKLHRVARGTLTSHSHFSLRGKLPRSPGAYALQVRIGPRTGNLAGKSAIFHIRRRR
jgi:hypothetical protein